MSYGRLYSGVHPLHFIGQISPPRREFEMSHSRTSFLACFANCRYSAAFLRNASALSGSSGMQCNV
jgi:hypothetical protein